MTGECMKCFASSLALDTSASSHCEVQGGEGWGTGPVIKARLCRGACPRRKGKLCHSLGIYCGRVAGCQCACKCFSMKRDSSTSGGVLCRERKWLGCKLSSGKSSGGVGDTCACSWHRRMGRSPGLKRKTEVEISSPWSIQPQKARHPWDNKCRLSH